MKIRTLSRLLAGFLACLCSVPLFAERVSKRVFEQTSSFKQDESILDLNVQTKQGSIFSAVVVDEDVKRLSDMGIFADVSAAVTKLPDGNYQVVFRMVAKPLVNAVVFKGNEKITDDKLREVLRFPLHTPQNDKAIMETAEAIRALYKKAGRDQTVVSPTLENRKDGSVSVIFTIHEELQIRINDVFFQGNSVYTEEQLRGFIVTKYSPLSANWLSFLPFEQRPGLYNEKIIEHDKLALREMYLRKGYLDFKILKVEQERVDNDAEMVNIRFTVEEGKPYFVDKVTISGNTVFTVDKLNSCIQLQPGNVYNVKTEQEDVGRIEKLYSPEGYADFSMSVIKKPNYKLHSVDLEYRLLEGRQFTIGDITINGNKYTKPHVILRELPFRPNDKLDRTKLKIAQSRLLGMNYFEPEPGAAPESKGVEVKAIDSEIPDKKDISIEVHEKMFINGKIGGGWSDTDGLAGMLEISHSNMDILDPAHYFTGGGQRARIYALIGTERANATAEFTEPWLFGIPLKWNTEFYWRNYSYDDWKQMHLGFTTSLEKRFFDDFTAAKLGYTFEAVKVHDMDDDMSYVFQQQEGTERVGRIFLELSRDTRDSYTDPHMGYFISLYGALTTQGLGASVDYWRAELKGIGHYSFFNNWFTFSLGGKIGLMDSFGSTDGVPLFDRYFLGGGDSIRGFPYRSIGPVDYNDDNYGGQFMYIITAELSHPIYKDYLRGAFFCDFGDATERNFKFTAPNMGIGYGIRIKLPYFPTPIRLDLAYPIINNQEDVSNKLRFHFNLGFAFGPK